ncbi:hypothetical protein B0H10DRAFT_2190852 [Mycena sp. CBHHK59/15]|nr:hypothetical protein B0H10DRAFT_2190852 [Mycena sp. CBHHK59/15]
MSRTDPSRKKGTVGSIAVENELTAIKRQWGPEKALPSVVKNPDQLGHMRLDSLAHASNIKNRRVRPGARICDNCVVSSAELTAYSIPRQLLGGKIPARNSVLLRHSTMAKPTLLSYSALYLSGGSNAVRYKANFEKDIACREEVQPEDGDGSDGRLTAVSENLDTGERFLRTPNFDGMLRITGFGIAKPRPPAFRYLSDIHVDTK